MKYAIRVAGADTHIPIDHAMTVEEVLKTIERLPGDPAEVIIYRDDLPFMRHRPKNGGASLIARERASH